MELERQLFAVGGSRFRARHLIVVGVLACSFAVSGMIRAQAADYGFALHEYDPFFNYRATEYLVQNGLGAYMDWHDDLSWYPDGRDVSRTSQAMQHFTAAALYSAFGAGSSLHDFVVVLPLVIGSATAIAVFALVRVIAGTSAGLLASLLFAVSAPILLRGPIGWFKAEPIGLFYGVLGTYLLLSGISSADRRIAAAKLAGAGIVTALALSAWGGNQFFIIPAGVFFMALPFLRRDHSFLLWAVPLYAASALAASALFERPGESFIAGLGGAVFGGSAAVMAAAILIERALGGEAARRYSLAFVIGIVAAGFAVLAANAEYAFLDLPNFRYINAINPLLTTVDPLVDSVSEHATLTTVQSFALLSVHMVFAGIAVWLLMSGRERLEEYGVRLRADMIAYALIAGITAAYAASAFARLTVLSALAVIILASIGIIIMASMTFSHARSGRRVKGGFAAAITVMLIVPITVPADGNWISNIDVPPIILNGGTAFGIAMSDWPDALDWMRENTPRDSLILAWWDYGYWIETVAERPTLSDNLTISTVKIQNIASILFSEPDEAWSEMRDLGADYAVIFIAGYHIGERGGEDIFTLAAGGDETKKIWIARVAELDESEYIHADLRSPTPEYERTLIGQMTPFERVAYVNIASGLESVRFQPGFDALYAKSVKYPPDGDGPLRLAYASPSFEEPVDGRVGAVLVYEINADYAPPGLLAAQQIDTDEPLNPFANYAEPPPETAQEDPEGITVTVPGDDELGGGPADAP